MVKAILIPFIILVSICFSNAPLHSSTKLIGYKESGKASFYDMNFQSSETASGERFNQSEKTAAHKWLPFGTKVRVTNVINGQSVVVIINDRGPFAKGRIIDLSHSAFSSIGNTNSGVISVDIEVIE